MAAQPKLDRQGRVCIPQSSRQRLGMEEGDELVVVDRPDGVLVTTKERLLASIRGSLRGDSPTAATDALFEDRRRETAIADRPELAYNDNYEKAVERGEVPPWR